MPCHNIHLYSTSIRQTYSLKAHLLCIRLSAAHLASNCSVFKGEKKQKNSLQPSWYLYEASLKKRTGSVDIEILILYVIEVCIFRFKSYLEWQYFSGRSRGHWDVYYSKLLYDSFIFVGITILENLIKFLLVGSLSLTAENHVKLFRIKII